MRMQDRRWRKWQHSVLPLALLLMPISSAWAVERDALEAAIVFNLLQFVEWPGEGAQPDGATLTLCFKGDSPLMQAARPLDGRPVRRMVLRVAKLEAAQHHCQAVYIDSKATESEVRAAVREPALVIAGSEYRPVDPPSIQLVFAEGRIAFEINQRKTQPLGLVISSRLLKLARAVTE